MAYGTRARPSDQTPRHAAAGGPSSVSAGGVARHRILTVHNSLIDEVDRYPGNANDGQIRRDRDSVMHHGYSVAGRSSGYVDWTMSGPIRAERHVRQQTYRLMVGVTNNRNYDPVPTGLGIQDQGHGLHTTPINQRVNVSGAGRYDPNGRYQMQPARQNRLQPGRQSGRSYSETTATQGSQ